MDTQFRFSSKEEYEKELGDCVLRTNRFRVLSVTEKKYARMVEKEEAKYEELLEEYMTFCGTEPE